MWKIFSWCERVAPYSNPIAILQEDAEMAPGYLRGRISAAFISIQRKKAIRVRAAHLCVTSEPLSDCTVRVPFRWLGGNPATCWSRSDTPPHSALENNSCSHITVVMLVVRMLVPHAPSYASPFIFLVEPIYFDSFIAYAHR